MNRIFALVLIVLISFSYINAAQESMHNLSSKELRNGTISYFTSGWKYSAGNDLNWTSIEFNDDGWSDVNTFQNNSFPSAWNGTGYFRFHFTIDSSLFNKSVILQIWSSGKQEVYIDGKFITAKSDRNHPKILTFNQNQDHVLAVKYVNNDVQYYKDAGFSPGFAAGFANIEELIRSNLKDLRRYSNEQIFFTAITIAFGLLHLILFLYN
ncbi:MAG: hypothetical protein ACM34N_11880, partial [Ignavibacteria bacterium]